MLVHFFMVEGQVAATMKLQMTEKNLERPGIQPRFASWHELLCTYPTALLSSDVAGNKRKYLL
jgi:hypothetical protein